MSLLTNEHLDPIMISPNHAAPTTTPIHILGAGSIGMFLAASLQLAQYQPRLLIRGRANGSKLPSSTTSSCSSWHSKMVRTVCIRQKQQQQHAGLLPPKTTTPRLFRCIDIACETTTSVRTTRKRLPRIDTLLVTTKAFDAVSAIQSVYDRLNNETSSTTIVILSNGALAIQEELLVLQDCHNMIDHNTVALGTITHGVYQLKGGEDNPAATDWTNGDEETSVARNDPEMYHIVHAGIGSIRLEGHLDGLASILDQSGLRCHVDGNIRQSLWKKLAANCVINPLTSIHHCRNGELVQRVDGFTTVVMPNIVLEVYQVYCRAEGQTFCEKEYREWQGHVLDIVQDTAENRSSMLQDIEAHRRTEIDYLNGFVVQKAIAFGLPCDKNQELITNLPI